MAVEYSLEPAFPTIVLFDLTRTLAFPEMLPDTTTTILSEDSAACVNWARVETVVVAPPAPPVVLGHVNVSEDDL